MWPIKRNWICAVCGLSHASRDKFCRNCGTKRKELHDKYEVFISYRRRGGADTASVIQLALENFDKRVFLDVQQLEVGRFDEHIFRVIRRSASFVLVLSKNSLDECVNDEDWFRQEIVCAIEQGIRIIPVYLPDFSFPAEETFSLLPSAMHVLPNLQAVQWDAARRDNAVRKILDATVSMQWDLVGVQNGENRSHHEMPVSITEKGQTVAKTSQVSVGTSKVHDGAVVATAVSPDQTTLATAGDDGFLRLWNIGDSISLEREIPHSPRVSSGEIMFSPGGTRLITKSVSDKEDLATLSIFSFPDCELIAKRSVGVATGYWGEGLMFNETSMSSDDKIVVVPSVGTATLKQNRLIPWTYLRVMSTVDGQQLMEIDATKCLGISPDCTQLAATTSTHISDIDTGQIHERGISMCKIPDLDSCRLVYPAPDNAKFYLNDSWNRLFVQEKQSLSVVSFPDGNVIQKHDFSPINNDQGERDGLIFSHNGGYCVRWTNRGKAQIFDLKTGHSSPLFAAYDQDLNWRPLYIAPDETYFVVLTWKGFIYEGAVQESPCLKIFSIPDGKLQLKIDMKNAPLCGAFHQGNGSFFTGDIKGNVCRWDLNRGICLDEI